jgi:hypothetical protein
MHGGAPGIGAPKGERNGNYRHGFYTAEAMAERRAVRALLRKLWGVEDYADNGEFDGRITQLRTKSFKRGGRLCVCRRHARQPTTPRKRKLGDECGKALGPRGPVLPDLGG